MKHALVTGVSSGIGLGLVKELLRRGWTVHGLSRREPVLDAPQSRFQFRSCDLSRNEEIPGCVEKLLRDVPQLDLAILNAGILGTFADLSEQTLDEMQLVMQVNVWANKTLLDAVLTSGIRVAQVVTISSGAAVNGNRGWGGYSISKAALNMLTQLYARERQQTHFCALAPGLVDTAMQDYLCGLMPDERFRALDVLRSKRGTPDMPTGDQLADRLLDLFERLPDLVPSGEFADIRNPPLSSGP